MTNLTDVAAALFIVVIACAMGLTEIADPDLGFHLATGRAVLTSGSIPAVNVLSFTQPEHAWILHEWLPAVVFELVHRSAGFEGLVILRASVVAVTWVVVFAATRRVSSTAGPAMLATVLAMAAASMRFSVRPHIFTALLFAVVVLLATSKAKGRDRWFVALGLGALVVFCYQLHAGGLFLALYLVALVVGRLVDEKLKDGEPEGLAVVHLFAALGGGLVAAALLLLSYHPHGLAVMSVPFDLGGSAELHQHVVEYRPPWAFDVELMAFYWLLVVVTAIALATRVRAVSAGLWLGALGLCLLSLRHIRVVDVAAIAAAPILAAAFTDWLGRRSETFRRGVPALVVLLGVTAVAARWSSVTPGLRVNSRIYGVDVFDYMSDNDVVGPAYVTNGWGGPYLERFYPEHRVFFDPRFEAYSSEFVTDVYRRIRYGEEGWAELLDEHGVQVVALKYTTPGERATQGGAPNVRQRLVLSAEWTLVFFDDVGEVFLRTNGLFADVAARDAVRFVEPDRMVFAARPAASLPSLRRMLEDRAHSARLYLLLSEALEDAGHDDAAGDFRQRARAITD